MNLTINSKQWRSQDLVVVEALVGWGIRRSVSSPQGRSLRRGMCPLPRKCSDFWCEHDVFWCILALFLVTEWTPRKARAPVPRPMATPVTQNHTWMVTLIDKQINGNSPIPHLPESNADNIDGYFNHTNTLSPFLNGILLYN